MKRMIKSTIAAAATIRRRRGRRRAGLAAETSAHHRRQLTARPTIRSGRWSRTASSPAPRTPASRVDYRAPETFDMVAMSQLIDAAVNQNPAGTRRFHSGRVGARPIDQEGGRRGHPGDLDEFWIGRVEVAGRSPSRRPGRGDRWKGGRRETQGDGRQGRPLRQPGSRKRRARSCAARASARASAARSRFCRCRTNRRKCAPRSRRRSQSNPDVDTILALGAGTAGEPSLAAVKDSGKIGKINVGTFDLSADFLKAVAAGEAAFCIDQQQFLQGYLPVVFLANYAKYGLIPASNVASGPNLITKDKAAQVVELSAKGIR